MHVELKIENEGKINEKSLFIVKSRSVVYSVSLSKVSSLGGKCWIVERHFRENKKCKKERLDYWRDREKALNIAYNFAVADFLEKDYRENIPF